MGDWVDFKSVKEAVTMEMVLAHYDIELRRVNRSSLRGDCPLPYHSADGTGNSFSVSVEKNAFACQSASCVAGRDGRKGGNVLDLVAVMEGCSIRDAALKLQEWFSVEASNERPKGYVPSRDRKGRRKDGGLAAEMEKGRSDDMQADAQGECGEAANQPLGFELKSVDVTHPYIRKRGIKQETASHFGIGFFHGRGSMEGRVVIPIHDEHGELIGYAGRAVGDKVEPKYKVPAGFRKSLVLFNLHRVLASGKGRGAIVVEGFFDALKVHQAGFPSIVALMGAALSEQQEELLVAHFGQVVIMLDGDEGGRAAVSEIATRLMVRTFVRVVNVPDGTQPDRLSSDEIRNIFTFLDPMA